MNLRLAFAETIKEDGHWVLLRRANLETKCPCVNSATDEPRKNCQRCNGSGHSFSDHPVRVRKTKITDAPEVTTPLGQVTTPRFHYYLLYNAKPWRS